MTKKKNFSLKKEYIDSWNYLKDSKKFIYTILGIFFLFFLIGFFIPSPVNVEEQIMKLIKEIIEKTMNMSHFELIEFIFLNNLMSSLFGIIFGVFLGIFPIVSAIFNGYLLGFVSSISVQNEGILIMWRLFPHGIFELPAVFIALSMGLKLGSFIFQKNRAEFFRECFWNSLRVFVFVIIPLLFLAAIIEGTLISVFK